MKVYKKNTLNTVLNNYSCFLHTLFCVAATLSVTENTMAQNSFPLLSEPTTGIAIAKVAPLPTTEVFDENGQVVKTPYVPIDSGGNWSLDFQPLRWLQLPKGFDAKQANKTIEVHVIGNGPVLATMQAQEIAKSKYLMVLEFKNGQVTNVHRWPVAIEENDVFKRESQGLVEMRLLSAIDQEDVRAQKFARTAEKTENPSLTLALQPINWIKFDTSEEAVGDFRRGLLTLLLRPKTPAYVRRQALQELRRLRLPISEEEQKAVIKKIIHSLAQTFHDRTESLHDDPTLANVILQGMLYYYNPDKGKVLDKQLAARLIEDLEQYRKQLEAIDDAKCELKNNVFYAEEMLKVLRQLHQDT